jgi:DNA-binding Xre family transcriptional regulator
MTATAIQTIRTASGEELVVLPKADFDRLVAAAEDREDVTDAMATLAALKAGTEERVPAEMVDRLLGGESKLRVWREYRRMTLKELAAAIGVSVSYLSMVETGKRTNVGLDFCLKAAGALCVDIDDLF